jgi:hypothetical protein
VAIGAAVRRDRFSDFHRPHGLQTRVTRGPIGLEETPSAKDAKTDVDKLTASGAPHAARLRT